MKAVATSGESLCLANDIASLRIDGQNGTDLVAGDEKQSVLGERAKHLPIKGDADLRGPSRLGEVKPVSARHVHGAPDLQTSDHGPRIEVSRASHSSTPLDGVADITTSVCARGEVLRSQPLPMALSLFGIFPNLPAPRCALIEPWAPPKFPREPATPITDEDIVDVTFGLLVGVRREGTSKRNGKTYRCLCRCGAECVKEATKLLQGTVRACRYNCPKIDELVLPWKGNPTSARSQQKVIANRNRLAKFREAKQAMPESEPWRKAGMSRSAWYRAGRPGK